MWHNTASRRSADVPKASWLHTNSNENANWPRACIKNAVNFKTAVQKAGGGMEEFRMVAGLEWVIVPEPESSPDWSPTVMRRHIWVIAWKWVIQDNFWWSRVQFRGSPGLSEITFWTTRITQSQESFFGACGPKNSYYQALWIKSKGRVLPFLGLTVLRKKSRDSLG